MRFECKSLGSSPSKSINLIGWIFLFIEYFFLIIMKFIFYLILYLTIFLHIIWSIIQGGFYRCVSLYLEVSDWVSINLGEVFLIFVKWVIAEIVYSFCMYGELVSFWVFFYDPFATCIFFYFFIQILACYDPEK